MDKKGKLALIEAFLGNSIFGFSFLFSKRALAIASPDVLLGFRFTVAFLLLNLLMCTGIVKLHLKNKPIKYLIILGIAQPVFYFICETKGLKLLDTSFVGILIAVIPIVATGLGAVFLKEKVTMVKIIFIVISIAGVILTTLGKQSGGFNTKGFLFILGAVFSAAMYDLISRRSSQDFSTFERTYVMFAIGCLYFMTSALLKYRGSYVEYILVPMKNMQFWISIVFLSGISSVGAFLLLNHAISHLKVAEFAVFSNVTTVISILAGVFFLHESFGVLQIIGSIIIILGVYGVNML